MSDHAPSPPPQPHPLPASALHVAEPPAAYLARPPMVVDCSALGAILFDEPARDEALARLVGHSLHAPHLLDHEIASAALDRHRQGGSAASLTLALADYAAYALALHPVDVLAQFRLAQRYELPAGAAAYLWLAAQLRAPLATFDRRLATAAQAHLRGLPGPPGE